MYTGTGHSRLTPKLAALFVASSLASLSAAAFAQSADAPTPPASEVLEDPDAAEAPPDRPPPEEPATSLPSPMDDDDEAPEALPDPGDPELGEAPPPGYAIAPAYAREPAGYGTFTSPPGTASGPATGEPAMVRNSVGLMVAGIVLTSIGSIVTAVGAAIVNDASEDERLDCGNEVCAAIADEDARTVGVITALGGLAIVGAGVPMIIVGAREVPAEPQTRVELRVGPTSLGMHVTF